MRYFTPIILFVALIGSWICYAIIQSNATQSEPTSVLPTVTASIYPVAFLAERIGGSEVNVHTVTPPGVEPHDFEPSPRDRRMIEESRVLFMVGGGLEPWGQSFTPSTETQVVQLKSELKQRLPVGLIMDEDPHIWLSPKIMIEAAGIVSNALVRAFPEHESVFRARTSALISELNDLDREYQIGLLKCSSRDLVTSHNAFGYLSRAYDLHTIAIAGISPDAEPSAKDLVTLAALVKDRGVSVIFFEELASPKLAETLASETGARTMKLDPIEGLAVVDQTAGKDYFTQMRQNLSTLQTALHCTSL